jgi:hypothetical protein
MCVYTGGSQHSVQQYLQQGRAHVAQHALAKHRKNTPHIAHQDCRMKARACCASTNTADGSCKKLAKPRLAHIFYTLNSPERSTENTRQPCSTVDDAYSIVLLRSGVFGAPAVPALALLHHLATPICAAACHHRAFVPTIAFV